MPSYRVTTNFVLILKQMLLSNLYLKLNNLCLKSFINRINRTKYIVSVSLFLNKLKGNCIEIQDFTVHPLLSRWISMSYQNDYMDVHLIKDYEH